MALGLEQFVKQLEDSGILSPSKIQQFLPPQSTPKTVEELAKELVKQNHLTRFQAQEIYQGRAKSLILGGYTLLEKIGAGGMGEVYKAHHRRLDRTVAIKMLPKRMTKDAAALARFEREVRAAAKLRHSNIVATDDANEAGGVHFLVMEYIAGSDLSALVKKNGPFSVEKAVDYILQAARGLEFAHGEGVIHRDIKPSNLLLDKRGTVKILDMGLARIESGGIAATQAELTGTGAVMGTVDYMAPEQAMNTKRADARADIYSLGCTLYYLLTGAPLYGGETVVEKLMAHQTQPIPTLLSVRNDVPEALDAVLQKMLAKTPADRYQSMTEVIADLQIILPSPLAGEGSGVRGSGTPDSATSNSNLTFLNELPTRATTHKKTEKPSRPAPAGVGNRNRRQILIACAGAGLAALLLAGIIVLIRNRAGQEVARIEAPDGATAEVQQTSAAATAPHTPLPDGEPGLVKTIGGATAAFRHMEFAPDGRRLLTCNGDGSQLWDVGTGQVLESAKVSFARFFPDGQRLLGQNKYGTELWVTTGSLDAMPEKKFERTRLSITVKVVSPDGRFVATQGWIVKDSDCEVWLWNVETGAKLHQLRHTNWTQGLAFSPDSRFLVTASDDNTVQLWDVESGQRLRTLLTDTENLYDAAFSSDGRWVVAGGLRGGFVIEAESGQLIAKHGGQNKRLVVLADNRHVAWGNQFGAVTIRNLASGEKLVTFDGPKRPIDSLSLSPDGRFLASCASNVPREVQPEHAVHIWRLPREVWPQVAAAPPAAVSRDSYALDFDGKASYVATPIFYDASHPITVEAYVTPRQVNKIAGIISDNQVAGIALDLHSGGRWCMSANPGTTSTQAWAAKPATPNQRVHLAGVWSGGNPRVLLFVDGVLQQSISAPTLKPSPCPLAIGANPDTPGPPTATRGLASYFFDGIIDEVRISKLARYTESFTPPARHEPDADTLALYHFDEGTGDIANDASAGKKHARIFGAKWVRAPEVPKIAEPALELPATKLVELKELNNASAGFSFVSSDGRTIYWEGINSQGPAGPFIHYAVRNNPQEPFVPQGLLLDGNWRHPTVSDDGLQLVMVKNVGGLSRLYGASRTSVREPFGTPRELTEFDGVVAREKEGPCLSPDGLTLCFQAALEGAAQLYVATRRQPTDAWSPPRPLPIEIGPLRPLTTWPMLAEGGKVLFCSYEQAPGQARIMVWRRGSLDQPFREFRFVEVGGKELIGYVAPRYVKATNELYLTLHVNRRLFVVKNFHLTPEETASSPPAGAVPNAR